MSITLIRLVKYSFWIVKSTLFNGSVTVLQKLLDSSYKVNFIEYLKFRIKKKIKSLFNLL